MNVGLARLHYPVTALGPGTRIGIWLQGCTIGCAGCASRDTWPADGARTIEVAEVLRWCDTLVPDGVDGVTISGGEPSEQPGALTALVNGLADRRRSHGWDLLCYTGVEEDEFARRCPGPRATLDALVTGPYRAGAPTRLVWRGSANQRLIPLSQLGVSRYARWVHAEAERPLLQVQVDDDTVRVIGIPRRGDLGRLERLLAGRGVHLGRVSWRP
jgi:anaerobic ribonucleoside-triphosphate reductase activating protein